MVTTEQIKALRDQTGVSVMQCKKALEEAGGDIEKALAILKDKSKDIASKKADREFGAGIVQAYVHSNGTVGAMVELVCETDFVSKNEEFKAIARDIAMHISATQPKFLKASDITEDATKAAAAYLSESGADASETAVAAHLKEHTLLEQAYIKNPDLTIQGLIDSGIQKFGEKIEVARFARFSVLEK